MKKLTIRLLWMLASTILFALIFGSGIGFFVGLFWFIWTWDIMAISMMLTCLIVFAVVFAIFGGIGAASERSGR